MVVVISSKEFRTNYKCVPEFYLCKAKYYLPNGLSHYFTYFQHVVCIDYMFVKACVRRHKYIYIKFPVLDCCQHPLGIQGVVGQYVLDSGIYSSFLHPESFYVL